MAVWIIGYGIVQASAPRLLSHDSKRHRPSGRSAVLWAFVLMLCPVVIAIGLQQGWRGDALITTGLIIFGIVFAINSALHSYLILAYSDQEKVAINVGFYYMANAGGRLLGTILSGWLYQTQGITGCLWWSAGFILMAALLSFRLPEILELNTVK